MEHSQSTATVVLWNVEWASRGSARGDELANRVRAEGPDLVCLTEVPEDFDLPDGHRITSAADYGYRLGTKRRKVLLWSRSPWRNVDPGEGTVLPGGRFIRGQTDTPIGPLDVWGICVPWQDAHVRTGRRDRARWQDHCAYLEELARMLKASPNPHSLVMLGDFNQRIPPRRVPPEAAIRLAAILTGLQLATAACGGIDHVAHTGDLSAARARVLNADHGGRRLSDHDGRALELRRVRV